MKKKTFTLADGMMLLAVICVLAACILPVIAGTVYDRQTVTLTAGAGTYTQADPYAAAEIKRIWIENSTKAANTVAVNRVTSDNAYTQSVGTVTFTSGSKGNNSTLTAAFLEYGDKLTFSSTAASNSVAVLDLILQKH